MDRQCAQAQLEATLFGPSRGKMRDIRRKLKILEAAPSVRSEIFKILLQPDVGNEFPGSVKLAFHWLGLRPLPLLIAVVPLPLVTANHAHLGMLHGFAK